MFPWYHLIFLSALVFPILLLSHISLQCSLKKALSLLTILKLYIQKGISFLCSFAFCFSSLFQLCKPSSRICLQCRRCLFNYWTGKILWRKDRLPTPVFLGFPCGSAGNESACNAEDLGSIPGLERSPGEGKGYPPQYSGLENSMDPTVHGITKSQTQAQLSDLHFIKASSNNSFAFLHSFLLEMVLISASYTLLWMSVYRHSVYQIQSFESICHFYYIIIRDLI